MIPSSEIRDKNPVVVVPSKTRFSQHQRRERGGERRMCEFPDLRAPLAEMFTERQKTIWARLWDFAGLSGPDFLQASQLERLGGDDRVWAYLRCRRAF